MRTDTKLPRPATCYVRRRPVLTTFHAIDPAAGWTSEHSAKTPIMQSPLAPSGMLTPRYSTTTANRHCDESQVGPPDVIRCIATTSEH